MVFSVYAQHFVARTRWKFTTEMLSHHASNTLTSWDFATYGPKVFFKIVQRNANFNFRLWNRLRIIKSNVDSQGKNTMAWKESLVVSEPVCKAAFLAVNWYYSIFSFICTFCILFCTFGILLPSVSPTVKLVICEWTVFKESDQSHRFIFGPMSFI